ncbi:MAG: UvrD-helicase domain-containing protein, partial [Verrucomicrobiota bacterium]
EQLQNEYLRQKIFETSEVLSLFFPLQKGFTRRLAALGRESAAHPYALLKPDPPEFAPEGLDLKYQELIENLSDFLEIAKTHAEKLNARSRIHKYVAGKLDSLSKSIERGYLLSHDIALLDDLVPEAWEKALKKSHQGLSPPVALLKIASFKNEINLAFQSLLLGYRQWLSQNLREAKERRNVISFNDLIHRLNSALSGDKGEKLAQTISSRYDAALIDEFQDTDPVQYQIAHALFSGGSHYLFFIGDPKQAIYRFRGADIFAYFQATRASGVVTRTLEKNYRSRPQLLEATNALFQSATEGFVYDEIEFKPVQAGRPTEDFPPLSVSPLQLHILDQEAFLSSTKESQTRQLAKYAAEELSLRLADSPELRPDDVAFLVNNRYEADALAIELERRDISPVIRAERSIFETAECAALRQLLESLSAPSRLALKRGLLLSSLCGLKPQDLAADPPPQIIEPIFQHLSDWAKNWSSLNFDVSLRQLLFISNAFDSLADGVDGERRYTNLTHLAELLEEARNLNAFTPQGLLNWLESKRHADVNREEDYQTRLSSDEGKPQIITIHKSKGLQFPIVILPFISHLRVQSNDEYSVYHDDTNSDHKLVIDMSPDLEEEASQLAYREELAEKIRLLYVALTRSELECALYLTPESNDKRQGPSAFAQMLLGSQIVAGPEQLPAEEIDVALLDKLQSLSTASPKNFGIRRIDNPNIQRTPYQPKQELSPVTAQARSIKRPALLDRQRILSFSALSRQMRAGHIDIEDESPNDESLPSENEIPQDPIDEYSQLKSIYNLPKGVHAGDLLHLILERADFSKAASIQTEVSNAFEDLQFHPSDYQDIVFRQILMLCQAKIQTPHNNFRLADIPARNRIPELEFAYPVSGEVQSRILEALSQTDLGKIPAAWLRQFKSNHSQVTAFLLRGFIDLVFEFEGRLYIIDWKSNHLGDRPSDYSQVKMQEAMAVHDYYLQYLLYTVALKRFLENRYPRDSWEDRFGGVLYTFIRGLKPGTQNGIYYDLPTPSLIQSLDEALYPTHSPALSTEEQVPHS